MRARFVAAPRRGKRTFRRRFPPPFARIALFIRTSPVLSYYYFENTRDKFLAKFMHGASME